MVPGECTTYSGSYNPDQLINGSNQANTQTYTDTASVTGTRRLPGPNGRDKMNTASANCPLCPPVH